MVSVTSEPLFRLFACPPLPPPLSLTYWDGSPFRLAHKGGPCQLELVHSNKMKQPLGKSLNIYICASFRKSGIFSKQLLPTWTFRPSLNKTRVPQEALRDGYTLVVHVVPRNTIDSQMSQPCFRCLIQALFECSLFPSLLQTFRQVKDCYEVWDSALWIFSWALN